MSGFDDRDRVADKDGAQKDLDHDAPGVDVAGPAAVAQAAELLGATPEAAAVSAATPAPAVEQATRHVPVEAPRAVDGVSFAGGGGGVASRGQGGAAQILDAGPDAAVDAAAQLRVAEARRFDAILDEPAVATPVALRAARKKPPTATTPTPATEVTPEISDKGGSGGGSA